MIPFDRSRRLPSLAQAGDRTSRPDVTNHVYKSLELTGSSTKSSDDAIRTAIARASRSVRNIKWLQVLETRGYVEGGDVAHWQVTVKVGFTLEDD